MDARSLVFDDTNLFELDKHSGWDRIETDTRANVGTVPASFWPRVGRSTPWRGTMSPVNIEANDGEVMGVS